MGRIDTLNNFLTDIADSIRTKKGTTDKIKAEDFSTEIEQLEGGEELYFSTDGRIYPKKVVIPSSVKEIGGSAYYACRELEEVFIPDSVITIGNFAFQQTGIKSINIPNSVTTLGMYCISGCSRLTYIFIPSSITSIGTRAFNTNNALTEVVFGEGFNCSIDISTGNYSVDVMLAMFEALKDNTGGKAETLTLGTKNLNKLTDEQKAMLINKNWNLA